MCKFTAHENACLEDTNRVALLSLAVAEDLRACYRCGELYEGTYGCNHMRLVTINFFSFLIFVLIKHSCTNCPAEFCYNCGKQWGICLCGNFSGQARRLVRTGEVVDSRPASGRVVRVRLLPENCPHENWARISNSVGQCHQCGFNTRHYLERCRECRIYSCTRYWG